MTKVNISIEDIEQVSDSISVVLTPSEKQTVLERYPAEQKQDKEATWNLVVEHIIHQVINERKCL